MKRLGLLLTFLLLATPARASDFIAQLVTGTVTTTSPASVSAWSGAEPGMLEFMACGDADTGTFTPTTVSCTGGTNWTQVSADAGTLPFTNTTGNVWYRTVCSSGEPSSFSATYGTGHSACTLVYVRASDGTTPTIDAARATASASAGSLAVASVNALTANDFLLYITVGSFGLANFSTAAGPYFPVDANSPTFLGINAAYGGMIGTGATPTPTFTFGGTGVEAVLTVAIKNTATTAVNMYGHGAGTYNSSAANSVGLDVPSNATTGGIELATVTTYGSAPTIIPSDFSLDGSCAQQGAGTTRVCVVNASTHVGDRLLAHFEYRGSATPPAPTAGENSWTLVGSPATCGSDSLAYYTKIATSGDVGQSQTWTGSTNAWNIAVASWYSSDGAISVDTSAFACSASANAPAVTTTHTNELIQASCNGSASTTTFPSTLGSVWTSSTGPFSVGGYYLQSAAGASATPTCTSAGTTTFFLAQVALQPPASPWTQLSGSPTKDAENGAQMAQYWRAWTSGELASWPFWFSSQPTKSLGYIQIFNGLNATTPFDTYATIANKATYNAIVPGITPSATDEALIRPAAYSPSANQIGYTYIAEGYHNASAGAGSLYQGIRHAAAEPSDNSGAGGYNDAWTIGLNAATTPARTSAPIQINQAAIEVFSTTQFTPPAGSNVPPPQIIGFRGRRFKLEVSALDSYALELAN